jgi:hypothetical protein
VRIIGIGVEKVQIEPVLAGTSIKLNSAGEAASIELAANLDETRPKILSNGAPYFPGRFTLTGAAPRYGAAWVENFQFLGFQPRT